jgi:N-acetylhexosamine 1-kinase
MVMICKSIVNSFLPHVEDFAIAPLGSGLIHRTYLVDGPDAPYVFQELNCNVFRDPHGVMANILKVQSALADYPEPTLTFLPRVDGGGYLAADGEPRRFWRCAHHFPDTVTYDIPPAPAYLRAAARAFAQFGQRLSVLDASEFHPTIPRFHDTPHRFETFLKAWEAAAPERRSNKEYDALMTLSGAFEEFGLDGLLSPNVPQGVSHNDTKLDKIHIDESRFLAVAGGYIEVLREAMSAAEKERMVYAAFLMTYELALRFYTDHLQGDTYFGARVPNHNLIRARSQIRLAECWLQQRSHLEQMVRQTMGKRDKALATT